MSCRRISEAIHSPENQRRQDEFFEMSSRWVEENASPIEKTILYVYTLRSSPITEYLLYQNNFNSISENNIYVFIENFYSAAFGYDLPFANDGYVFTPKIPPLSDSDLDQLGAESYAEVDLTLKSYLGGILDPEIEKTGGPT